MRASLRQPLIAACLAAGAFAFAGCSYPEQFFIVNRATKPLVIVATADVWTHADTGAPTCAWYVVGRAPLPLRAATADRLGRDPLQWDEMTDVGDSTFDKGRCSVRATVAPSSAVLIWQTSNGRRDPFLTGLTLGEAGDTLDKAELLGRFRQRSRSVYVLEVE